MGEDSEAGRIASALTKEMTLECTSERTRLSLGKWSLEIVWIYSFCYVVASNARLSSKNVPRQETIAY
jgi:hypothetical protein